MNKILIIITTRFVLYGGLSNVIFNYYRYINKDQFHIDFASISEILQEEISTELKNNNSEHYYLGSRKKNTMGYLVSLYKVLKNNKYDIVHINSNSATVALELFVAKLAGIKTRIVHNHTENCQHKVLHKLLYPIFKHLYTDAIACSNKSGDWIFGENNYYILKNSIDTQKYKYNEEYRCRIREYYNINIDCVVLGHIGNFYKAKNHHFIIDIFKDYHKINNNSKLLLIGDGELREEIEKQIENYGLEQKVILAGIKENANEYLSAMDILVFPSLWEGFPLSLVEAQSSGIECICSNKIDEQINITGDIKMLSIDHGTKIWVEQILNYTHINREEKSMCNIDKIIQNGYDSRTNVESLQKIYLN